MGPPAAKSQVSIPEYLAKEALATERHEYHHGEVLMMAGGTYRHSRICFNVSGALFSRLRGHRCQASESNTRVAVTYRATYLYPDVTVVCGEPVFDSLDRNQTTVTNPTLIVEVLSESTEAYDRGAKFGIYRDLPSLQEYVLVSATEALVESYLRQGDGTWVLAYAKGVEAVARLRSLGIDVPLAEVYDRITFEPTAIPPSAPTEGQGK